MLCWFNGIKKNRTIYIKMNLRSLRKNKGLIKILSLVYNLVFLIYKSAYILAKHGYNSLTLCDPFKILWVNPNDIVYRKIKYFEHWDNHNYGDILDGNWDKEVIDFHDVTIFQAFKDRFIKQMKWEDIYYYIETKSKIIKNQNNQYGVNSIEALDSIFQQFDRLHKTIKEFGYKSQYEILESSNEYPLTKGFPIKKCIETKEVTVSIGRNGELIHLEGRHRLALAQLLNIKEIPVVVFVRHLEWEEKRRLIIKYRGKSLPDQLAVFSDHPDIKSILRKQ